MFYSLGKSTKCSNKKTSRCFDSVKTAEIQDHGQLQKNAREKKCSNKLQGDDETMTLTSVLPHVPLLPM